MIVTQLMDHIQFIKKKKKPRKTLPGSTAQDLQPSPYDTQSVLKE